MAEPFLGEIRLASFSFNPREWAFCDGQLLPINQNQALFALLGTTYGGDGRVTFALPNLQGRAPIHVSQGLPLGQVGGEQAHTLTAQEMPTHRHALRASSADASELAPGGHALADVRNVSGIEQYAGSADANMAAGTVGSVGGGQAHLNMQPYLTLNYIIALVGTFPSPN